jgi:hypothetical protein
MEMAVIEAVIEHVRSVVDGLGHADWAALPDHAERVQRLVATVPGAVWNRVSAEVAVRYRTLEQRYGRRTAIAILSAGILVSAVPVPGSTVLAMAPLIALVELHHQLTAGSGGVAEAVKIHLTESEILHIGRQWVQDLAGVLKQGNGLDAPVLALATRHEVLLMNRAYLLIVTAFGEVGTGLLLLVLPSVPLALLLGVEGAAPETLFVARIAGAALLAIGIACWLARHDHGRLAQLGLLAGVLIYDVAAAALLAYAGFVLRMVGLALWPAAVLHAALAFWCIVCLAVKRPMTIEE